MQLANTLQRYLATLARANVRNSPRVCVCVQRRSRKRLSAQSVDRARYRQPSPITYRSCGEHLLGRDGCKLGYGERDGGTGRDEPTRRRLRQRATTAGADTAEDRRVVAQRSATLRHQSTAPRLARLREQDTRKVSLVEREGDRDREREIYVFCL